MSENGVNKKGDNVRNIVVECVEETSHIYALHFETDKKENIEKLIEELENTEFEIEGENETSNMKAVDKIVINFPCGEYTYEKKEIYDKVRKFEDIPCPCGNEKHCILRVQVG